MRGSISCGAALALLACASASLDPAVSRLLLHSGRPHVGLWQAIQAAASTADSTSVSSDSAQQPFHTSSKPNYEAHCFPQPLSHFDPTYNQTFCQRYWIDASSYKPGGPVYVLDGGETSGADRLPFLAKGILQILSNATNGLSIVLEHRYYGESVPVPDLSTDNLRFLNNAEALADSANLIEHFKPPQSLLDQLDGDVSLLHPNNTPWIYYGGSYAGARAAHMRVEYPHLVWGAIASSAVTHAQVSMPEYYDPIMSYGPSSCIAALQSSIRIIDQVLDLPEPARSILKGMFGLQDLKDDGDFAEVLSIPLGFWQAQNWDSKVGSGEFTTFCEALTAGGASSRIGLVRIPSELVNYAKYIKTNIVSMCPTSIEECFGSDNDEQFKKTDLSQTWRLWLFQVCTQWGYFQHAPLEGPTIVSTKLTLEHTSKICRQAYPPGKHCTVPHSPNVTEVNARGGYAIEADRLAFIDGDRDPWRPMTPQAEIAPRRQSTANKPLQIIFDAIHHYDENGLEDHTLEPPRIRDVHEFEVGFVTEWLAQWREQKHKQRL